MKKKIFAFCVIICMMALAVVGGTLAYFSDTEAEKNTFTVGRVDIKLSETKHDGSPYNDGNAKKLYPAADALSDNAIPKDVIVTVDSNSEDCWVWVDLLIPAKLYGSRTETSEAYNALHFTQFSNYLDGQPDSTNPRAAVCAATYPSDHQWSAAKVVKTSEMIGTVEYVRLRTTHKSTMKANEVSSPAMNEVWMDGSVTAATNPDGSVKKDGSGNVIYNIPDGKANSFEEYSGSWEILVQAYAMQAKGFNTVDDAIKAYK